MPPRRLVFFGNCQAEALATVYEQQFGRPVGDVVTYMSSYEENLAAKLALYDADIAVIQQFDFPSKIAAEVKPGTQCVLFPSVVAGYLWPYGSRAHPRNEPTVYRQTGPYPAQHGDAFLNKLMLEKVPVDEAVARYMTLDIASAAHIDRLYELTAQRQSRRDEITGIETASFIEANFRNRHIFYTPDHPDLSVFKMVAKQVYPKFGLSDPEIDAGLARLRQTPFPLEALPLHPRLGEHFGIKFAKPDTRYHFFAEDPGYTFEEYIRRYYTYTWNAALSEGIYLSRAGNPAHALEVLDRGLQANPNSLTGLCIRSTLLSQLGRHDEAQSSAQKAVALWPDEAEGHTTLSDLNRTRGDLDTAVRAARKAVVACPLSAQAHVSLALALDAKDEKQVAVAAARIAADLLPGSSYHAAVLGNMLARAGDHLAAAAAFRKALALDPSAGHLRQAVAASLEAAGMFAEARAELDQMAAENPEQVTRDAVLLRNLVAKASAASEWENALALNQELTEVVPQDPHAHAAVGRCYAQLGRYDEAEAAYLVSVRLAPKNADICRALADVVGLQGRGMEALSLSLQATQMAPSQATNFSYLGHQLIRNKFDAAAEPVLRWALELDPETSLAVRLLAGLLQRQKRWGDALAVWQRYLELVPGDTESAEQMKFCAAQ